MQPINPRNISTIQEALNLIELLQDPEFEFDEKDLKNLTLSGELNRFEITISGSAYHGTVPGNLARGIWEFQREFYRAASYAIYNDDNYNRIPKNERKDLTLNFEVEEGSTTLWACLENIGKHLIDKVTGDMDSKEKASLFLKVIVTLTLAGGAVFALAPVPSLYFEHLKVQDQIQIEDQQQNHEREMEKIRSQERIRLIETQTQVFERYIKGDDKAKRFESAVTEGTKLLVKNVPDATRVSVGAITFDETQIEEINRRAKRESYETYEIRGHFRVLSTQTADENGFSKIGLHGNGENFTATVELNDPESPISEEKLKALFLAPKSDGKLYLIVRMKKNSDGVKEARIIEMPDEPKVEDSHSDAEAPPLASK